MTARKGASKAEAVAPPAASAEGPDTEDEAPGGKTVVLSKNVDGDEPDPRGEVRLAEKPVEPDEDADAKRDPAPEPVRKYQLARPAPFRAGGYVCTERGWVLDTTDQTDQKG